jgi:hypothetical protein
VRQELWLIVKKRTGAGEPVEMAGPSTDEAHVAAFGRLLKVH